MLVRQYDQDTIGEMECAAAILPDDHVSDPEQILSRDDKLTSLNQALATAIGLVQGRGYEVVKITPVRFSQIGMSTRAVEYLVVLHMEPRTFFQQYGRQLRPQSAT